MYQFHTIINILSEFVAMLTMVLQKSFCGVFIVYLTAVYYAYNLSVFNVVFGAMCRVARSFLPLSYSAVKLVVLFLKMLTLQKFLIISENPKSATNSR